VDELITYRVPGVSCQHCVDAVTRELMLVPGVERVTVDLESKEVAVLGHGLDDPALRRAIENAGYET
jgi:copper chaperone CopZ